MRGGVRKGILDLIKVKTSRTHVCHTNPCSFHPTPPLQLVPLCSQVCNTFLGTVTYMSPERINNEQYSFSADIWSLVGAQEQPPLCSQATTRVAACAPLHTLPARHSPFRSPCHV